MNQPTEIDQNFRLVLKFTQISFVSRCDRQKRQKNCHDNNNNNIYSVNKTAKLTFASIILCGNAYKLNS